MALMEYDAYQVVSQIRGQVYMALPIKGALHLAWLRRLCVMNLKRRSSGN